MLINHLFESSYGAAAGVETIRQLLHAVKDSKDIDLKVGPEMFPIEYGDARYLLSFFKANRHLGDGIAKYFGDANWIEQKLAKRDAVQSPDRLNKFDIERMKDVQKNKVLDLEEIHVDHDGERNTKKRMAESYKGWEYTHYKEDYGDVEKISHSAKKDGKEVSIDWSPYNYMTDEEFKTWVDLGMPTRKDVDSIGPLSSEDLESLMKTKLGTKARLTQEDSGCPCCDCPSKKECTCPPDCPNCDCHKQVNEGTWHIPDTPELVQGLNKWFKQDRPVGKNAELIQKSLGQFIGDDALYDDLEAVAEVSPHIDGRSLVMTWINDHMPEIADAMKGEKGFVMYEYDPHNVGKGQYSDFEVMRAIKVAQDYADDMTHAIEKIEAIKPGLSDHRAVKDELKKANEDKKDDITKKVDPKTKVALKKAQMKAAPFSKGDPVAAMAMGLEKDVNRLDKENDEEEADIAAQAMVDKYHTQELEQLKKMLDTLLKK